MSYKTAPGGPAMDWRSHLYPAAYRDRVPKFVRTPRAVASDIPFAALIYRVAGETIPSTEAGGVYPAWTNSHGAVAAVLPDGRGLGLKPGEFEVVEWYAPGEPALTFEPPADGAAE